MLATLPQLIIGLADLTAAFLFLYGLQRMSSPATAPSGILVAGFGMVAAVLASFLYVFTVSAAARPHLVINIGLALMMKDNIITIDWTDEVIAKTALTHDGKLIGAPVQTPAKAA